MSLSMFSPFESKEEVEESFNLLIKSLPKKYRSSVIIFVGMLEETIREGCSNGDKKRHTSETAS